MSQYQRYNLFAARFKEKFKNKYLNNAQIYHLAKHNSYRETTQSSLLRILDARKARSNIGIKLVDERYIDIKIVNYTEK